MSSDLVCGMIQSTHSRHSMPENLCIVSIVTGNNCKRWVSTAVVLYVVEWIGLYVKWCRMCLCDYILLVIYGLDVLQAV